MPQTNRAARILSEIREYLAPSGAGSKSLPPAAYVDEELFALEKARIFAKSWVCVARADSFASEGDYLALTVAGEPMVVVRGADGALRALSNVCRHRLYPLVPEGRGKTMRFTCAYHKWVYGLNGKLGGAPFMEDTPGFDRTQCALPEFRLETWLGFVFVSLAQDPEPLAPQLEPIARAFANYDLDSAVTLATYHKVWAGNWKLAVENASECYHHMGLHQHSVQPYLPASTAKVVEINEAWIHHTADVLEDQRYGYADLTAGDDPLSPEDRAQMKVFTIFPGLVVLAVGDFAQGLSFIPRTVDSVDVHIWSITPAAIANRINGLSDYKEEVQARTDAVNAEDELGTALLQANASSAHAQRGWLSTKEGGLPGFFAYLARQLADQPDAT